MAKTKIHFYWQTLTTAVVILPHCKNQHKLLSVQMKGLLYLDKLARIKRYRIFFHICEKNFHQKCVKLKLKCLFQITGRSFNRYYSEIFVPIQRSSYHFVKTSSFTSLVTEKQYSVCLLLFIHNPNSVKATIQLNRNLKVF